MTALLAVPAVLALPVVTGPAADIRPVTPSVATLALAGIDPEGLATSRPPVVGHGVEPAADVVAPASRTVAAGSGAVVVEPAVAAAAPTDRHADDPAADPAADHAAVHEDVHADEHAAAAAEPVEVAAVTRPTSTEPFTLVAVDWTGEAREGTTVQVRVRNDGSWSDWQQLAVNPDHGPDPGSAEAAQVRSGTEPLLVDPGSDGVQVRIDAPDGEAPQDAQVSLIDPKQSEADALVASTPLSTAAAAGDPLRPTIITRAQWGADESLRSRGPIYTGTLKAGFLHHTASTSNYTRDQAAAQVRALYAYFTLSLGYSDIAYNFLVDRYGRLYEGRAGGMDKNVLGGHTAGFNENTFAVSALGNFDTYKPTDAEYAAIEDSVSRLFAWKFALNHVNPTGTTTLVSNSGAGTSNYAAGTSVTVPTVMGHGDIGSTACPGRYIETMVPDVRTRARALMGAQLLGPSMSPSVPPYGSTGTTIAAWATKPVAWKLEVFSPCVSAPVRMVSGSLSAAGSVRVLWDLRDSGGNRVRPGTYTLVLSASNGSQTAYPVVRTAVVAPTDGAPLGPCATAQRIGSTDRYAAAVQVGRLVAPTARTVVIASGAAASAPDALLAAPLAAVKGAPRLLVTATSVPSVVAVDIKARKATTAIVVGSTSAVSADVVSALRALGVTSITRLTGADRAATAAAVARAMGVRGSGVVVSFDSTASLDLAAAAAAGATAARKPLLVVTSTGVPSATASVMTTLGITSTIVVGSPTSIPDSVRTAVKGKRVWASTDAATSQALVPVLTPSATRASALPAGSGYGRAVAVGLRRPLVLGAGGTAGIAAWLAAGSMTSVMAVAPTTVWSDSSVGSLAKAITASSGTTPTAPTTTTGPAVPTSFVLNGSGYGHGVGMSQYGARGMALEGSTAAEIVQHFYQGTTVAPVADDMNIRVNLLTRQTAAVFRSEALVPGGGAIKVTVTTTTDGVKKVNGTFTGTAADLFTIKAAGSDKVTLLRTRSGVTSTVGTGTDITVNWEGTRYPSGLGSDATVVNVAASSAGLATAGHRYGYGYLVAGSSSASPSTFEVVNALRLGDEYLLGIAEVSNSWPAAALQAQVLAARSYALVKYKAGLRSSCLCHVDDGGGPYHDQTFAGWVKESGAGGQNWRDAVAATEVSTTTNGTTLVQGKAILSSGAPIQAFYYASSGGRTQSVQDVWVATYPYLQSVEDPWSLDPSVPYATWSPRERTQAQLAKAFGLPDVVRIDLSSRTLGGGVKSAVAYSSSGASATISGETMRTRLALPSTWVWRSVVRSSASAASAAVINARKSSSATVVLAPLTSPDMVAVAASLAAQKGWPLLLTSPTSATTVTKDELARRGALRATKVYAVGDASLTSTTLAAYDAVPGITVARVAGADASAVSVAAARLAAPAAGTPAVVVARTDFTSAAAASGMAGTLDRPLLVLPGGTAASAAVTAYLKDVLKPSSTIVVGTTTAVDDSVLASLVNPTRIVGPDAAGTAARVVQATGAVNARRVVVSADTSAGTVAAMASGPGVPLVVVGSRIGTPTKVVLQRGAHTLLVNPTVTDAIITLLRRA